MKYSTSNVHVCFLINVKYESGERILKLHYEAHIFMIGYVFMIKFKRQIVLLPNKVT